MNTRSINRPIRWLLTTLLLLTMMLTMAGPARAANFVVLNLNDSGKGSLRQAISNATASPGADTITFGVSGTIPLLSTLEISDAAGLTIDGTGRSITISGNDAVRVMFVNTGAVLTLRHLTIAHGSSSDLYNRDGGGIYNAGTLEVTGSTFSGNSGDNGGAISNVGALTIMNSSFSDNRAGTGGGIENHGTLHVTGSFLSANFSNLEGGGIDNNGELTIAGSTISGNHAHSFGGGINNGGTSTITNSTLSGNSAYRFGGGIQNGGTITLTNSTVSENVGEFAIGGIFNWGRLNITNSSVNGNYAYGDCGGMLNLGTTIANHSVLSDSEFCNTGTLTIADSTLPGSRIYNAPTVYLSDTYVYGSGPAIVTLTNSTLSSHFANQGGGIYNAGTLTMTGSTLSGNGAYGEGGGIYNYQGMLTITNSTLSGNSAGNLGGGIYNFQGAVAVHNSTLSGNSAGADSGGGGIFNDGGSVTLFSSIVAYTASGGNCAGAISDAGYNIEDADTCSLIPANGSLPNTDPLLGSLADNGGPTQTFALLPGSPAVDAASLENCPATDQRGIIRPQGAGCDIGAYESVVYTFSGFFQPVDNLPTWNVVQAGVGIPVRFSLGGDYGLNIFAAGYPMAPKIACSGGGTQDVIEETVLVGSSSLSYDAASDTYTYVWKTNKAWATTCRQLIIRLNDGSEHMAKFKFVR